MKQGDTPPWGEMNRLRWKCRRGMLELDIVLAQFLESGIDKLSTDQLHEFGRLLDLEDQELWRRLSQTEGMSVLGLLAGSDGGEE